MAPSGRPMYYKQSVIQVEQGEEESDVGPAAPSQSLTGASLSEVLSNTASTIYSVIHKL